MVDPDTSRISDPEFRRWLGEVAARHRFGPPEASGGHPEAEEGAEDAVQADEMSESPKAEGMGGRERWGDVGREPRWEGRAPRWEGKHGRASSGESG